MLRISWCKPNYWSTVMSPRLGGSRRIATPQLPRPNLFPGSSLRKREVPANEVGLVWASSVRVPLSSGELSIRFRQLRATFKVFYTRNNKNGSWRALYKNKEYRRKLFLSCMSGDFRESYHNTLRSHVSYQMFWPTEIIVFFVPENI